MDKNELQEQEADNLVAANKLISKWSVEFTFDGSDHLSESDRLRMSEELAHAKELILDVYNKYPKNDDAITALGLYHNCYGWYYARSKSISLKEQAIDHLEESIRLKPGDDSYRTIYLLSEVYAQLGKRDLEISNLNRALEEMEADAQRRPDRRTNESFLKLKKRLETSLEKAQNPQSNTENSSGCFIATAVYGSQDSKQVLKLRNFRDQRLKKSVTGKIAVKMYYATSPRIAKLIYNNHFLKKPVKIIIDRIIQYLD